MMPQKLNNRKVRPVTAKCATNEQTVNLLIHKHIFISRWVQKRTSNDTVKEQVKCPNK